MNGNDIANNSGSNTWPIPDGTTLSNYNTYGVLWTPTAVSWYFNNVLVETISTTGSQYSTWFAGQYPEAMALNIAAECNWAFPCSGQVSPLNMQVQWVHVYAPPVR
jgi:beta-glucanase (GH16 family)